MSPLLFRNSLDPDNVQSEGDPLDLPLVPLGDIPGLFSYLGEFSVPASGPDAGPNNFSFCGSGLTPVSDGVYIGVVAGAGGQQRVIGKLSIPSFGGTASIIHAKVGLSGAVAPAAGTSEAVSGARPYGGKLYLSAYNYYDGADDTLYWIRSANSDLTSMGPWCGMMGAPARHLAGGLCDIPTEWQSVLGGPMGCLGGGMGIVSYACNGYGLGMFDPSLMPNSGSDGDYNVPVTVLLNYPLTQTLETYGGTNASGGRDYFSVEGSPNLGFYIIPGSRTGIFVMSHGYGTSNACDPGSSVPSGPARIQILPYDMQDLVDVKNGAQDEYDPRPYGWIEFPDWASHFTSCVGFPGGYTPMGGFDITTKRLYMVPDSTNGADTPIKVWSIADYEA